MGGTKHQALEEALSHLAAEAIRGMGLEVVELCLRGSSAKRSLRLDIDRAGAAGVGLDDCSAASRAVGRALDESDLVAEDYALEVSSPGIDRPIRSADDIRRNTGRRIVITTVDQPDGARTLRGVLLGIAEGDLRLHSNEGEVRIPFDRVAHAQQDVTL